MDNSINRADRLGEQIRRALGEIISRQKHADDLSFTSITAVKASPDLSVATVYITCVLDNINHEELLHDLNHNKGFFRKKLSKNLNLRKTPALKFIYDESIEYASKMEHLIDSINKDSNGA